MQRIFLVGPRACGKTTAALALAERLACPCLDTDALIIKALGESIADFVARMGWAAFRERETQALRRSVEATADGAGFAVVATGGGMVLKEENRALMRASGLVFFLECPAKELVRRLEASPLAAQRPSLTGKSAIAEAWEVAKARLPLYRAASTHVLDSSRPIPELLEAMLAILRPDAGAGLGSGA